MSEIWSSESFSRTSANWEAIVLRLEQWPAGNTPVYHLLAELSAGMPALRMALSCRSSHLTDDNFARTVDSYRRLLLRAQNALLICEAKLFNERARLAIQRDHIHAARNWSNLSRSTF